MAKRKEYAEKYKDPRWQKKRLEVLARDEWICKCCGDNKSTLHVHHRYYGKGKELWEYPLEAFVTLCEECHLEERDLRPGIEESMLHALREKFLYDGVSTLAIAIHCMPLMHTQEVVASVYEWAMVTPDIQKELIDRYFEHLSKKAEARKPKDE